MIGKLPMTPGRLVTLIVGLPAALLIIGAAALHEVSYAGHGNARVRIDLPVRGRPVTIKSTAGNLNVGESAGRRLRLTGTARYSFIKPKVTWQSTRSGLIVASRCVLLTEVCTFDYGVALPPDVPFIVSDGSGEITVTGLVSTDVTVSDGSGNVTLTFSVVPDRVTVTDNLGRVTLVLPAGSTAYQVHARASLGRVTIGVPTNPHSPHVITVVNHSGNITITS